MPPVGGGGLQTIVVAVAVVAFMVYRQFRARRLSARMLLLIPAVLLFLIIKSYPSLHPDPTIVIEIAVDVVVSLVLGLLAARQLQVYASPETGRAMVRGSLTYFLWWLGAFVIKAVVAVLLGETSSTVNSVEILIPVFLLVATRNAYLYWRATRMGLSLH